MIITIPQGRGKDYEQFSYPAGELQVRFNKEQLKRFEQAADKNETFFLVANIRNGNDIMELCLLSSALDDFIGYLPRKILVLPYLPYSRADRRFTKGDCFGLDVLAGVLRGGAYFDEVRTLDPHSKVSSLINRLNDISPKPIIDKVATEINSKSLAVVLPDEGALRYGLQGRDIFQCSKIRDPQMGKLLGFDVPNIEGYDSILIVDDICDGGGTFIGIAEKLPKDVKKYLYTTHGIYSKGYDGLFKYFNYLFCSDSFNHSLVASRFILKQYPCLPLLIPEEFKNG